MNAKSNMSLLFSLVIILSLFYGCVGEGQTQTTPNPSSEPSTTVFVNATIIDGTVVANTSNDANFNETVPTKNETEIIVPAKNESEAILPLNNSVTEINDTSEEPVQTEQMIYGDAYTDSTGGSYRTKLCSIALEPQSIISGTETTVQLYAHSSGSEEVSVLCGDKVQVQGRGALFHDSIICQFDTPGIVSVWAALDDRICASTPLIVNSPLSANNKRCEVLSQGLHDVSSGSERIFWSSVYLANFEPDSQLKWNCSQKEFSKKIGDIFPGKAYGVINVSCTYAPDPGFVQNIQIWADSINCGEASVQ
ncbi:MAG: hypothetical protein WC492_03765 [Candidatus Micrarchaeia archaeon]